MAPSSSARTLKALEALCSTIQDDLNRCSEKDEVYRVSAELQFAMNVLGKAQLMDIARKR